MADGEPPLLSYVIGRLDRALRGRLTEVLAPCELTIAQFTTLSVLARRPGLSNAQLARRALIAPQSMIQVIAALEQRALIARTPAAGRTLQTTLTDDGRAVLRRAERATRAVEDEMLGDDTDPERLLALTATLQHLTERLGAAR